MTLRLKCMVVMLWSFVLLITMVGCAEAILPEGTNPTLPPQQTPPKQVDELQLLSPQSYAQITSDALALSLECPQGQWLAVIGSGVAAQELVECVQSPALLEVTLTPEVGSKEITVSVLSSAESLTFKVVRVDAGFEVPNFTQSRVLVADFCLSAQ